MPDRLKRAVATTIRHRDSSITAPRTDARHAHDNARTQTAAQVSGYHWRAAQQQHTAVAATAHFNTPGHLLVDKHTTFFWRPHSLSALCLLLAWLVWEALVEDPDDDGYVCTRGYGRP